MEIRRIQCLTVSWENALEAASKYDRAIAVMYDLSGFEKIR